MVEVTQADRDAAAAYWKVSRIGNAGTQRRYLSGEADNSFIVQAFARHRIAAAQAERAAVVEWLKEVEKPGGRKSHHWSLAAAIEAGEHRA